jgi:hypothetical protein
MEKKAKADILKTKQFSFGYLGALIRKFFDVVQRLSVKVQYCTKPTNI